MDFRAENAVIKESVAIAPNVEILGISVSPPAEPISNGTASRSTSYTCQFFDLSALDDKKYHAVQFQPIIDDANKKKVHHILLYECPGLTASDLAYRGSCYPEDGPDQLKKCNFGTVVSAWGIGGGPTSFPDQAGFAIGKGVENKGLLMEIHYDNYDNVEFTDSSGLRMSYTPTLRPHDIGVLYTGSLPGIAVPPGIEAFDLNARCPSMCQETLPSDGVTVFASVLHMHTAGRAMSADLLAQDGTFKASLGAEPFYDFNFQTTNNLDVTMMPSDQLHTKCTFGTLDRSETTIFGLRTQDEMCLAYLWYYPRVEKVVRCIFGNANMVGLDVVDITPDPVFPNVPIAFCDSMGTPNLAVSPKDFERPVEVDEGGACDSVDPEPSASSSASSGDAVNLGVEWDEAYMHSIVLDEGFELFWSYDDDAEEITFAAVGETEGWVGLGFGKGTMAGSDVVVGWVDDAGTGHVSDRFATGMESPVADEIQNLKDASVVRLVCEGGVRGQCETYEGEVETILKGAGARGGGGWTSCALAILVIMLAATF